MKMRLHKKICRTIKGKFRNKILSRHGLGILTQGWNGLLVVEAGDFSIGRRLLNKGSYDREQIKWLFECVGHDAKLIVIVGAHIGSLLVPLARVTQNIIGFEPDKMTYRLLQHNLLLNSLDNADVRNFAIGEKNGTVKMVRNNINTGNTSVDHNGKKPTGDAQMIRLDDALPSAKIDLMIMDIEGHELHALKGAMATIKNTEQLYIEFAPEQLLEHGTDPMELLQLLSESFPFMYMFEDRVHGMLSSTDVNDLVHVMGARGYLKDLLFTKHELPFKALTHTS